MRSSLLTATALFALSITTFGAVRNAQVSNRNVQLIESTPASVSLRCAPPALSAATTEFNGKQYSTVTLPDEATTYAPGRPVLPAVSRFVVVSPTSHLELVVTAGEPRRVKTDLPPLLTEAEEELSVKSSDADGVFPPVVAEMGVPFIIRGVRMVKVTVYPVRFDSRSNEYLFYDGVETEVRSAAGTPVNPITGPEIRGRSAEFAQFINDFAVNGGSVSRDDPERDREPTNVGKYLIVVNERLVRYIIPFIEFRRKAGYQVDILSLSNDDALDTTAIKDQIHARWDADREAGRDPFEYLLLVGDFTSWDVQPAIGDVLASPAGFSGWNTPPHSDYEYACLEGDDHNPDVAFARWPGGTEATLGLIVNRQLAMSANPAIDHPEVYDRAAACSQHWGHTNEQCFSIGLHMSVRWGEEVLKRRFSDVRFYEETDWDQGGAQIGPFISDQMNAPINILIGRAQNYYFQQGLPGRVQENFFFPVNLNLADQDQWSESCAFRNGDANHLKGFVATTGGWFYGYNLIRNMMWMDLVSGVIQKDMPIGWAWNYSLNNIERYFPAGIEGYNGMDAFLWHRTDSFIFGDPAFQPWMSVPEVVEMEYSNALTPDSRVVDVFVHSPGNAEPVEGADVTLYAPGRIPLDNAADYAGYDQILQKVSKTDAEGRARFVLDNDESFVSGSYVYVTASGRNIKPCFGDVRIGSHASAIVIGDWSLEAIEGNGDEFVNPGETVRLHIAARNLDNADSVADLSATVRSLSPYVEVDDNNRVQFGAVRAGQQVNGNRAVRLDISATCPDGVSRPVTRPELEIEFTSGDNHWISAVRLDPHAPHLEFRSVVGGAIIPDSISGIDIEIANIGSVSSPVLFAQLHSLGREVAVLEGDTACPAINPGGVINFGEGSFRLSGSRYAVPGSKTKMMLTLQSEGGFFDTTYFELQVSRPQEHAPLGPDKYGYICFDDGDTAWNQAPMYDWVEINADNQNADYQGERIGFNGRSSFDMGEAAVVPLGFETQFYGEMFDTITVGSNGFIAVGSQPRIVSFQPSPMDEATGGGVGMIAPFWNDLRMGDNSSVWYYYDEENGRFFVEWSRMKFAVGDAEATFQVRLVEHDGWPSATGDQVILFQYKVISNPENVRNGGNAWISFVPYASVGISSPDGRSGLSYTWNNSYSPSAAPLQDRRALLFGTSPQFRAGSIFGQVTDAATGAPIEGAWVLAGQGPAAMTNADGVYRIATVLAEIPNSVAAGKRGYNDSTVAIQIADAENLEVNFRLLHPEFVPSARRIGVTLEPNDDRDIFFTITNAGNGPLTWSAEKRLIGEANAEPWEVRRSFNVGQSLRDDRIQGVAFAGDRFYLAGAAGDSANTIYVLNRDGERLRSFNQPGESRYGMRDLEWDGELLWGAGAQTIYGFTTNGETERSFNAPNNPTTCIAYDSDSEILWVSGSVTNIEALDRDGNPLGRSLSRKGMRIYGLAYWSDDPDGYKLYILDSPTAGQMLVHKMNTVTGDTLLAYTMPFNMNEQPEGAFISRTYDIYSWVMMFMENIPPADGSDRLSILQLGARKDWFDLDVWGGTLEPNLEQDFLVSFNSADLPDTTFRGEFVFHHNAVEETTVIAIELNVVTFHPIPFSLLSPADGDTLRALPAGEGPLQFPRTTFIWASAGGAPADSNLTYHLQFGIGGSEVSYPVNDTFKAVNIDTLGLPLQSGEPLVWGVYAVAGNDTANCTEVFRLFVEANGQSDIRPIPVAFGLHSIYPSPFNAITTIRFGVVEQGRTVLSAFDVTGRRVAVISDRTERIGNYEIAWNAAGLPSGIYVLRLESAGKADQAKVTLLR